MKASNDSALHHDRFLTPDLGYDPTSCRSLLVIPDFPEIFSDPGRADVSADINAAAVLFW